MPAACLLMGREQPGQTAYFEVIPPRNLGRDLEPERLPRIDRRGRARTVACDLHDHGLIRGRAVPMRCPGRVHHEAAGRHRYGVLHVESVAGAGIPCSLKHRDVARVRMPMWPIHYVRRKFRPHDVQSRLVGIALKRSHLRAVSAGHVQPMHFIGCDPEKLRVAGRRGRAASDEEKAGRGEVRRELHHQDPPQVRRTTSRPRKLLPAT